MNNKPIRVFSHSCITSCLNCSYFNIQIEECGFTGNNLSNTNYKVEVPEKHCPFSKPLSKEQIESCGFILKQHRKFDHLFTFKKNCSNKFYRGIYTLYIQFMEIEDGLIRDKHHIHITWKSDMFGNVTEGCKFSGSINNFQEFKLILKMLNIE